MQSKTRVSTLIYISLRPAKLIELKKATKDVYSEKIEYLVTK